MKRGEVVMFGGEDSAGLRNDTWVWTQAGGWAQRNPVNSPPARAEHRLAFDRSLAQPRLVLIGGKNAAGEPLTDTWQWAGSDWLLANPAPAPRLSHAMAWHAATGKTVLFGGFVGGTGAGNVNGETWTWDGSRWTREPGSSPTARAGVRAVLDTARQRLVLFGGNARFASPALPETWEWDGANWLQSSTPGGPPKLDYPGLAYDPVRGRTVLFGGDRSGNGSQVSNETWEWDGIAWQQRFPANSPPARYYTHMAFDPRRQRVLLFSGQRSVLTNDTWEWNGVDWSPINVAAPPARFGGELVLDTVRNVLVLHGGSVDGQVSVFSDVWEWDGAAWSQRSPAFSPLPPRWSFAVAFDARRGMTVAFGGWDAAARILGDTWEYGPDAGAAPFGQACQGEGLSSLSPPVIGAPMTLGLSAPATTIGFAWLGLSDQTWIGPLPHPFPAPGTRPGCDAFVSFDLLLTAIGGGGSYTLPLPRDPSLAGVTLFLQAFGVAPNLSFTTTNGLRIRIGGL